MLDRGGRIVRRFVVRICGMRADGHDGTVRSIELLLPHSTSQEALEVTFV